MKLRSLAPIMFFLSTAPTYASPGTSLEQIESNDQILEGLPIPCQNYLERARQITGSEDLIVLDEGRQHEVALVDRSTYSTTPTASTTPNSLEQAFLCTINYENNNNASTTNSLSTTIDYSSTTLAYFWDHTQNSQSKRHTLRANTELSLKDGQISQELELKKILPTVPEISVLLYQRTITKLRSTPSDGSGNTSGNSSAGHTFDFEITSDIMCSNGSGMIIGEYQTDQVGRIKNTDFLIGCPKRTGPDPNGPRMQRVNLDFLYFDGYQQNTGAATNTSLVAKVREQVFEVRNIPTKINLPGRDNGPTPTKVCITQHIFTYAAAAVPGSEINGQFETPNIPCQDTVTSSGNRSGSSESLSASDVWGTFVEGRTSRQTELSIIIKTFGSQTGHLTGRFTDIPTGVPLVIDTLSD